MQIRAEGELRYIDRETRVRRRCDPRRRAPGHGMVRTTFRIRFDLFRFRKKQVAEDLGRGGLIRREQAPTFRRIISRRIYDGPSFRALSGVNVEITFVRSKLNYSRRGFTGDYSLS